MAETSKVCQQCGKEKEIKLFPKSWGEGRKNRCKACYGTRERFKMKRDMLDALGWQCSCCGEDHPLFLSMDHIKNDGGHNRYKKVYTVALELRRRGIEAEHTPGKTGQQIYREARAAGWDKERFQTLCMNCNFAKGHFGECPHKSGLTKEESTKMIRESAIGTGERFRRWHRRPEEV